MGNFQKRKRKIIYDIIEKKHKIKWTFQQVKVLAFTLLDE